MGGIVNCVLYTIHKSLRVLSSIENNVIVCSKDGVVEESKGVTERCYEQRVFVDVSFDGLSK